LYFPLMFPFIPGIHKPSFLLNKFGNPAHTIDLSFSIISDTVGGEAFSHQNLSVPIKESNFGSYQRKGAPINDVAYSNAVIILDCCSIF